MPRPCTEGFGHRPWGRIMGGGHDHHPRRTCLTMSPLEPAHESQDPSTRLYVGDCRGVLARLPERGEVDLIFADPPFNWDVAYGDWDDDLPARNTRSSPGSGWMDASMSCRPVAVCGSTFPMTRRPRSSCTSNHAG